MARAIHPRLFADETYLADFVVEALGRGRFGVAQAVQYNSGDVRVYPLVVSDAGAELDSERKAFDLADKMRAKTMEDENCASGAVHFIGGDVRTHQSRDPFTWNLAPVRWPTTSYESRTAALLRMARERKLIPNRTRGR